MHKTHSRQQKSTYTPLTHKHAHAVRVLRHKTIWPIFTKVSLSFAVPRARAHIRTRTKPSLHRHLIQPITSKIIIIIIITTRAA